MSVLFITGAGVSAPSGVPTYRGETDSKYNDKELMTLMSVDSLDEPKLCSKLIKRLEDWKDFIKDKTPNKAHELIAQVIEKEGGIVLTQNVDDLHEKAGLSEHEVFHLHGSLFNGYKTNYPEVLDVVLFGEEIKDFSSSQEIQVKNYDTAVLVGTSLSVLTPVYYIDPLKPICIIDKRAGEIRNTLVSFFPEYQLNIVCIEKDVEEGMKMFMEVYNV